MVSRPWPLIPMTYCSLRIGHKNPWCCAPRLLSTHAYVPTSACSYLEPHNKGAGSKETPRFEAPWAVSNL
jgi:hypothetical protein